MKTKPSAWLTPREAANLVGWTKPDDDRKMIRALRKREKAGGPKVLQIMVRPQRTRLMVSLSGLRAALPDLFVTSDEHLPVALTERFAAVEERIAGVAARGGAHGSKIREMAIRLTALEAIMRKVQSGELRLVKGGKV